MIFLTITDNLENLSEKIFLYGLYICLVQTNIVKINYGIMNKKRMAKQVCCETTARYLLSKKSRAGLSWWLSGEDSDCQCRRQGSDPCPGGPHML